MRRKRRKGLREGKEQEGEKEERSKGERMINQGKGNIEEESKDRKK